MTPLVVGVAGGTASGKSTIVARACEVLGALRVAHDRYYRDGDSGTNFDHPDALETDLLVEHVDALRAGRPVALPDYDFATHRRVAARETVHPTPVIVVEGILALVDPALRARLHLAVYVDAPADIRLIRRLRRDVRERGRTHDDVLRQYLASVRPMHEAWVAPSAAHAQVVLDGTQGTESQVARLLQAVEHASVSRG